MDTNRRTLLLVTAVIGVALAVAGLVRAEGGSDYADQVAEVCKSVDDKLRESHGGYFDAVVMTSQARADGLAKLRPDAAHAALHAELLAVEGQLTTAAQYGQQLFTTAGVSAAAQQGGSLRDAELQQNERYKALGVQGCAD